MVSSSHCYCPQEKMHNTGNCSYRFYCIGTIRDIALPKECQGSTNYHVEVDVFLKDAVERFDKSMDPNFLRSITTFTASGSWPQTELSLLQYMPALQKLYLVGNQIRKIARGAFYSLSVLEILDLSHNHLSDIEDLFEMSSSKMKKLNLAHNAIEELPEGTFYDLTSLIELDLSHNSISNLEEGSFYNLTNLETLRLNNNKIENQNGALNVLGNLTNLYLSRNVIQNIDDLVIMKHLEIFDISKNRLEFLTPELFLRHWQHLVGHSVCKIILSNNQLTSLANGTSVALMSRFTRSYNKNKIDVLTQLDLSNNSISNIEYNAFRYLVRLTTLNLSHNKIIDFIVNPEDLTYVKYLNLSNNYIFHLYFESFLSLKHLENLDLSHNNLDYIPENTFEYNNLMKHVNMTYNEFKVLRNLHIKIFHPEGGIVDLSNNGLSRLSIALGEGLRLKRLMLKSNNITDPTRIDLIYQNELEHVDMSNNYIQYLNSSSLRLPINITHLDLSYNRIEEIGPATFHKYKKLNTLRLSHNIMTQIEYGTFQGNIALVNLDLSYNDIAYLDAKVLMDLKSLNFLSVKFNNMIFLDYKSWVSRERDVIVYIDGNKFTCDWLGTALSDYNNNYSKMRPRVLLTSTTEHSLEGIPCVQKEIGELMQSKSDSYILSDNDRLLAVNLKILEAIKNQTYYLRRYMWRSLYEESNIFPISRN
ncbi:uncharacterized protein ACR2FA_006669 [Aphomia sociella]